MGKKRASDRVYSCDLTSSYFYSDPSLWLWKSGVLKKNSSWRKILLINEERHMGSDTYYSICTPLLLSMLFRLTAGRHTPGRPPAPGGSTVELGRKVPTYCAAGGHGDQRPRPAVRHGGVRAGLWGARKSPPRFPAPHLQRIIRAGVTHHPRHRPGGFPPAPTEAALSQNQGKRP